MLHTFFVAGGEKPRTVLSGFNVDMLATAFNASQEAVTDLLSSQTGGAIMYASKRNESTSVSGFRGSIMGILGKYIGLPNIFPRDARGKPFNIFKKAADFSNDYGSTTAVHEGEFRPLKDINKGVFSVSLKAGALLAPHWNPTATEIALVTEGEGEIHVVYPNGSAAVTEQVGVGDVFVVPQNFPMCQIAARSGVFKFVGFSTSSRPNHPQFIAGLNSVLKALDTDVLAVAYNIPVKHIQDFLNLQPESVILPGKLEQTIFLSSMSEVASTKRKGRSSFFA
ncbi:hypothetical protein KP509_37G066000 [Ceratopteris richardii]|nr:hypothetical protein KP509_37G066000 [Ceratopteris richardii]